MVLGFNPLVFSEYQNFPFFFFSTGTNWFYLWKLCVLPTTLPCHLLLTVPEVGCPQGS